WDDAARRVGVTVNTTPTVGAIAVNDTHNVGHVAYVNAVYSDGSFDVEEYNWNTSLGYGTRSHLRVSSAGSSFQYLLQIWATTSRTAHRNKGQSHSRDDLVSEQATAV
ncbi:CHAP domain-containing protein, partial [Kitasatospora nipponensis]|uniref:CHAP domain-containing protein n=1 Tax=Kitasatospora nipponensis TaxID=258049 RepID=UPI0031DA357A